MSEAPPSKDVNDSQIRHLDHELGGVKTDVATLRQGQAILEQQVAVIGDEMRAGFVKVFEKMESQDSKPPKIGLPIVFAVAGITFPIISLAAAAILMLVNPIVDRLDRNEERHAHEEGTRRHFTEKLETVERERDDALRQRLWGAADNARQTGAKNKESLHNVFGRLLVTERDIRELKNTFTLTPRTETETEP